MRKCLLTLFLAFILTESFASHIVGGELYYTYIGPGVSANSSNYTVTLRLFTECGQTCGGNSGIACPPSSVIIGIFQNISPFTRVVNITMPMSNQNNLNLTTYSPCLTSNPTVCYKVNTYSTQVELANNTTGYRLAYQNCCRAASVNVQSNASTVSGVPGATYETIMPGSNLVGSGHNSNAVVKLKDTALICYNSPFTLEFGSVDPDGDSISYQLQPAYNGGSFTSAQDATGPDNPLYGTVAYSAGYSGTFPMGNLATINPLTGTISGTSPSVPGKYVVNVIIYEYRNGILIAQHRKDFLIRVNQCTIPKAILNPIPITCDGFNVSFQNANNANVNTWFWDFGVPGISSDTSNLPTPSYAYPDTGTFTLKLVVNRGTPCADSATTKVKVYPGFIPDFNAIAPFCKGVPVQFQDNTTTNYGSVTGWRWDFGDPAVSSDTSNQVAPSYVYNATGQFKVTLIVGNTFGCIDTVFKNVTVLNSPTLTVFPKDTTYCGLDSIQLTATGTGSFNWTPATSIIGNSTPTPRVFPSVPTTYYVSLTDAGCTTRDSVKVIPKNDLTVSINASASSICEEDTITLTGISNYSNNISYNWAPPTLVSNPTGKVTKAYPVVNTTFSLTGRWGNNCVANASLPITVKPLAVPHAGPGGAFCFSQGSTQLSASGGDSYQWSPATGLNNATIPNPVATPSVTTLYTVYASVNGCSKKRTDTVRVIVRPLPPINLVDDTLICSIDTIQLTAGGTGNFTWSPNYNINTLTGPGISISPDVPTTYYTTLTDGFGCISHDTVFVDVKQFVTIDAGNDTLICRTDAIRLNTTSDALHYSWFPSLYLSSDTAKRPIATPLVDNITYTVIGNIGKCQSTDKVTIYTVTYPNANAGNDTTVCFGYPAQLYGTGGSIYTWSPPDFLSATNIPNPAVINPTRDIKYTLEVKDTKGCPKPVYDDVWVYVSPLVIADAGPRDTSVVIGQPLPLNGSGGTSYLWSPSNWINNPNAGNTIAFPQNDIEYTLLVKSAAGCEGRDSIRVRVFQLPPSFYVPTAFSPNRDGTNDVLRPITLGMKSISYFRVYNRWGELIFSTTEKGRGWDGTYKGTPQDPGTYVWMAEGITYKDERIVRKGSAVLIR